MIKSTLAILTICILVTGCKNEIPFDKTGWAVQGDLEMYPNRDRMLNDLIKNQKLAIGVSGHQRPILIPSRSGAAHEKIGGP
jgi:hypothetical protein